MRVRERYQLDREFVLYAGNIKPHKNLDRLIEAFQLLRQEPTLDDLKLLIIGDEISKYRRCAARCTGTSCTSTCASSATSRTRRSRCCTAWPTCSSSRRSTKGSAAAARGHGQRHAGGHVERLVAARGRRRRRGAGRSARAGGDRATACAACCTTPICARRCGATGLARAREFSWERSVRRVREIYGEVLA